MLTAFLAGTAAGAGEATEVLLEEENSEFTSATFDSVAFEEDPGRFTIAGNIETPAAVEQLILNDHSKATPKFDQEILVPADGFFRIVNVPPGNYSLEVLSHKLLYPDYKIELRSDSTMSILEYAYPGAPRIQKSHPIQINAETQVRYFKVSKTENHQPLADRHFISCDMMQPREKLSLSSIIFSQSFLMIGFMILMTVGLPKMMENMDPEQMEAMQQQQAMMSGGDPMEMMKKMFSGELVPPEAKEQAQSTATSNVEPRRGKTDRRKGKR